MAAELDIRQFHPRHAQLLARRAHQGAAFGHTFIRLIDTGTIEHDLEIAAVLGAHGEAGGDLIAHRDGFEEPHGLFQIDGTGTRQLGAQDAGDQPAAEPAMGDGLGHGHVFRAIHQAGTGVAGD